MVEEIEYEPQGMKNLLKNMKDISELMVDLAYSAVLYDDKDIAEEVLRLEEEMDVLSYHARIAAMLGARRIEEAEELSGVLQIASAAEKMSNAAGDIANIVLKELGLPPELKIAIPSAEETVTRVRVNEASPLAGKTLGEFRLEAKTGMVVIALRRNAEWEYNPNKKTAMEAGDVLFAKGPDEGVTRLYKLATGEKYELKPPKKGRLLSDLAKAVDVIIEMKNLSELAIGLAYSALLFYSEEIAHEVEILEAQMDEMKYELEHWVLEASKHVDDVNSLRGLLHLATSSEVISDAADEISDVVLRDIELHPVFMLAIRESGEIITKIEVVEGAKVDGKTLKALQLETETGMFVLAIRRADKWVYRPSGKTTIKAGDLIIARGPRGGEKRLAELCSSKSS
ncbi:MAG: TrkA C-terminal domain-containing protein [Methanocellales archaeon]|nr:TrkA C-terminal domain-containing protein [Methanocellales archaeon]